MISLTVLCVLACIGLETFPTGQQSDVDRLEAIRMCSTQVANVGPRLVEWKKGDMKKFGVDIAGTDFNYSGHFNGEMKRCFVEITNIMPGSDTLRASDVYDAFEGQFIGTLFTLKRKGEITETTLKCEVFGKFAYDAEYKALMTK